MLPSAASPAEAERLVAHHSAWIERHLGRIAQSRRALALRPSLVHGRELLVDGRSETLRAADLGQVAALERRLRREARRAIERRVASRAPELGVVVRRVTIRDQRTRWGSASRSGTLSFSWRLVLCPPDVLDYVVVHELAHLRHAGHGRSFWDLVDIHHPDASGARRWLREHHVEIRHALD